MKMLLELSKDNWVTKMKSKVVELGDRSSEAEINNIIYLERQSKKSALLILGSVSILLVMFIFGLLALMTQIPEFVNYTLGIK